MAIFWVLIFSFYINAEDACSRWFSTALISVDSQCELKCLSLKTDFSTVLCKDKCESFCKPVKSDDLLSKYYGLTADETNLVKNKPYIMSQAYLKSWDAESLCGRLYKYSDTNDESDACRHFVWAALLTESFGREAAEDILNAHENNPAQPEAEKSMDLANNRRGVSVAEKIIKDHKFDKDKIIENFKSELKSGNLIVLKKNKENEK